MSEQIKSKSRVAEYGEVITNIREIRDMLNLVKNETQRLDSKFLEPACGDGQFILEVLREKLVILKNKYYLNKYEYEKHLILVVGSTYGIDILEDNVITTRSNIFKIFENEYKKIFFDKINLSLKKSIQFVINKNIIWGDALTLLEIATKKPIIFSEWSIIGSKVKRRDFSYNDLIAYAPFGKDSLFSDLNEEVNIPSPVKTFDLINYDKLYELC